MVAAQEYPAAGVRIALWHAQSLAGDCRVTFELVQPGIKTRLITGAPGSGKTAFILQLLEQKPAKERWAILTNKLGKTGGNDDLLLSFPDSSVFTRRIEGGCLCCTFRLQMQGELNRLLAASNPHQLLIELPAVADLTQVIQLLSQPWYQRLLQIREITSMVDGNASTFENFRSANAVTKI
jgi:G3E family GTPase